MKELTYDDLLHALRELTPEQKHLPARIAIGRKVLPIYDTALSCECNAPARAAVGENYPILIGNSQHLKTQRKSGEHYFVPCGGHPRCADCGCDEDDAFVGSEECCYVAPKH